MNSRWIVSGAFAIAALSIGAVDAVEPTVGAKLGVTAAEIVAALAAEGYEVTKYERERREIEVEATRDGRRWEMKIDPQSGEIVRLKQDD
jgi:predicted fused transcriptional regulator/phosphomethylpyrimidine kinase